MSAASSNESRGVVVIAFFANLGIAIAKFVGFSITGAASMLAEAVHSLADTGNQGLLLLGGSRAQREPTPAHPFGYGRERYFWAFVVALVLFSVGGLFAIYEGIQKLSDPHELSSPLVAVSILVVAIGLESVALAKAVKVANKIRGDASWWSFIRHAKSPEVPVVLLEDIGAELGLFVALGGIITARVTGDPRWDAAGSLAIGVLLIVIAVVLAIETKSLLIGESASVTDQRTIRSVLESSPEVRRLVHLQTQHLGPDELLVGASIEMTPGLSLDEAIVAIRQTEVALRAKVPAARVIYLEPDLAEKDLGHPVEQVTVDGL